MNKLKINVLVLFAIAALLSSCEDVVDVELNEGTSQLTVDAWLTNEAKPQEIRLFMSKPYFDSSPAEPVTDATVLVIDQDSTVFPFTDPERDGIYTWTPPAGEGFGRIGNRYTLLIETAGDTYISNSMMNRVPPIDSLVFTFEEEQLGVAEGYYGEFFARDYIGVGDTYWIKTFKNGQYLNKPAEINIAYDAGFSAGGNVDGLIFIPPIRFAMNRVADTGDGATDTNDLPPYVVGDSVYVEIHSITNESYYFLEQARTQMTNGGLFAEPLANVPTNIFNTDDTAGTERKALGYFNVAAVSGLGARVAE